MNNDGGYYAIKGFEYQIDKTILEILYSQNEDTKIAIERIQDIDSDNFVMQVKYKETQEFKISALHQPIIQLLQEFKNDPGKTYYLYIHFKSEGDSTNLVDSNNKITLQNLDRILSKKNQEFTTKDKSNFIEKFLLVFSPTFQEQFSEVITKIQELGLGETIDEAIFYYSNIADYLRKIVVSNTLKDKRNCTRKQLIDYIHQGKRLIFNSSFKEYQGNLAYYKFVKAKFMKPKRNHENFIFIGDINIDPSLSLGKLILEIIEKYYHNAMKDLKPLTIILDDKYTFSVKEELIQNQILFNDGYEHILFKEEIFYSTPIINKKTTHTNRATDNLGKISFKLRIISYTKFKNIKHHSIIPNMTYLLDFDIDDLISTENSSIKIDKLNTKEINDIFQI